MSSKPLAADNAERMQAFLALGVVGLVVFFAGISNRTLNWDDLGLASHFQEINGKKGLLGALVTVFFGTDLGAGEYRLYGFARITQFFLSSFSSYDPTAYFATQAALQILSSLGIYQLLRHFQSGHFSALVGAMAWLSAPLSWSSCYHHYSYTLLPLQFFALSAWCYISWLKRPDVKRFLFLSYLLCILSTFSGEIHQPIMWLAITSAAAFTLRPLEKKYRRQALVLMVTIAGLVIAHRLTWGALTHGTGAGARFQAAQILGGLTMGFYDLTIALKSNFIWQFNDMVEGLSRTRPAFVVLTAAIAPLTILILQRIILVPSLGPVHRHDLRNAIIIFALSPLALILFIPLFAGGFFGDSQNAIYGFSSRYTNIFYCVIATAGGAGIAALIQYVAPRIAWVAGSFVIALLLTFPLLQRFTIAPALRHNEGIAKDILAEISKSSPQAILVINGNALGPNWETAPPSGATRGLSERIRLESSPLDSYWSLRHLFRKVWNSPRVYCGFHFAADGSGKILLDGFDGGLRLSPKDIAVISSSPAVDSFNVVSFTTFDDYLNSPVGRPLRIMAGRAPSPPGFQSFFSVNLGRMSNLLDMGLLPDKAFDEGIMQAGASLTYGFSKSAPGETWASSLPQLDPYFESNRHGNFSYIVQFDARRNVPGVILIDVLDRWYAPGHERTFDLALQINNRDAIHYPVSIPSMFKADAGAIAIPLWPGEKTIRITFSHTSGDIPFANGLRILDMAPTP